jgi:hypothetical protein
MFSNLGNKVMASSSSLLTKEETVDLASKDALRQ